MRLLNLRHVYSSLPLIDCCINSLKTSRQSILGSNNSSMALGTLAPNFPASMLPSFKAFSIFCFISLSSLGVFSLSAKSCSSRVFKLSGESLLVWVAPSLASPSPPASLLSLGFDNCCLRSS